MIVPFFFGWDYPPLYFIVAVHFATLMAVLSILYRDIFRIIKALGLSIFKRKWRSSHDFKTGLYIILATIPAAFLGYFLDYIIGDFFLKPLAVAGFLLFTAFILWGSEIRGKRIKEKSVLDWTSVLAVGIGQALAIFPGISRSGSTISFARFLGIKRQEAVKFSFLLSVPIILGSFVFEISRSKDIIFQGGSDVIWPLITGAITAYLSGYFAIKYLLYLTKKNNLNVFAIYCICFSACIFIFYTIKKFF